MKLSTVSAGASEYDLAVQPSQNLKSPIFVYLNERGNTSIGSYVYTIGRPQRDPKQPVDTYSTVLQGDGGGLQDLASNMGRVLVKRFGCPAYVSLSGSVSLLDFGLLSQEIVSACKSMEETGR